MKSEDGVIQEATIDELKKIYLHEEYFKIMSWNEFLTSVKRQGAMIIGKE